MEINGGKKKWYEVVPGFEPGAGEICTVDETQKATVTIKIS